MGVFMSPDTSPFSIPQQLLVLVLLLLYRSELT
jgi:hypothetical protein